MREIEEIQRTFREGRRGEALRRCEALCLSNPQNLELKRLCALMHGMMGNFGDSARYLKEVLAVDGNDAEALFNLAVCERKQLNLHEAERHFLQYTRKFPKEVDGWTSLAECQFQAKNFSESLRSAKTAVGLNATSALAWNAQGDALLEMGRYGEAVESLSRALQLAPNLLAARSSRADALNYLGRAEDAVSDYRQVLQSKPDDEEVLKKISVCLVKLNRGGEALQLFRKALDVQPSLLTAKLGIAWVLSEMIPTWHVPMMNEGDRNDAYYRGMQAAIGAGKTVLEIGTGSGLLSMMAAKLGAGRVVTCEAVSLIAETAQKIVERNRYQDRIKVLAKTSFEVELGRDLPEPADVLVHEIFSSELIAEHVLPAIEDAKRRLLKPDARILPAAASIMIALVGGEEVGKYLHVNDSFGFDLQPFNAVTPKKIPLYREDLDAKLLSDDIEAFRFDFMHASSFPREDKTLEITATAEGLCYGVIQWIRMAFDAQVTFENHPSHSKSVSNWQRTVFCFDEPIRVEAGMAVPISASHDRSAPWFSLVRR